MRRIQKIPLGRRRLRNLFHGFRFARPTHTTPMTHHRRTSHHSPSICTWIADVPLSSPRANIFTHSHVCAILMINPARVAWRHIRAILHLVRSICTVSSTVGVETDGRDQCASPLSCGDSSGGKWKRNGESDRWLGWVVGGERVCGGGSEIWTGKTQLTRSVLCKVYN